MKVGILIWLGLLVCTHSVAQDRIAIKISENEYWYGGMSGESHLMPYQNGYAIDQSGNNSWNQVQPFLISNQGRYIWSESPIAYSFTTDSLIVSSVSSAIELGKAGNTLREAYAFASKKYFPPAGTIPDSLLFTAPQYNTWIELIYNQNQEDVLSYAKNIVDLGFPPGVIMIDDNWQEDYGTWEFKSEKFSDPLAMIEQLQAWGFKVMLWVCPFISPDSENFRKLRDEGLLLKNADNVDQPAIIKWWNGYSGHLDFTNPKAVTWFKDQLDYLQKTYGVDGFKLDAGDFHHYAQMKLSTYGAIDHINELSTLYAQIGLDYQLNEYRACWKLGGQPLAQRLKDKDFSWEAVGTLIPGMINQGLLGYPFACPDMIGGGEYRSFLKLDSIDQEMLVRSAQVHALMPMMQFSVAPWRVLDEQNLQICKEAARLHHQHADLIMSLADHAAKTGEPIIRSMEYQFPGEGFATVLDQFMLGPDILVAPAITQQSYKRKVKLPKGKWKDELGNVYLGGREVLIDVPLHRLPYFKMQ